MTIERYSDGENFIFKDYLERKIIINENNYLELSLSNNRKNFLPVLDDLFLQPTEVWFNMEEIEGESYFYLKYIKVFKDAVFIAFVIMEDEFNFTLNNFYIYDENEFDKADEERVGKLIHTNS